MASVIDERDAQKRLDVISKNDQKSWDLMSRVNWDDFPVWDIEALKAVFDYYSKSEDLIPDEIFQKKVSLFNFIKYSLAFVLSFFLWLAYSFRCCFGFLNPSLDRCLRLAAIHPEWSTRTRHILSFVNMDDTGFDGVLVIGRCFLSRKKIADVMRLNGFRKDTPPFPIIFPLSFRSFFKTLLVSKSLFCTGVLSLGRISSPLPLRVQVGIIFRVFLGDMSKRWWLHSSPKTKCSVYFGHTGTADTTLLEYAIQKMGGRSIHLVHGQSVGPNFAGCSDLAIFRSQHDCDLYRKLGCYDLCIVNRAGMPQVIRGDNDILLLSNLAHPMNAGYLRNGIEDEIRVLHFVSEIASSLDFQFNKLLWKPHPVLSQLPKVEQSYLRDSAARLGFEEISFDADVLKVSLQCKWVFSTPSTVAIDLLCQGVLPLVVDVQGINSVGSLSLFPDPGQTSEQVCSFLQDFDDFSMYTGLYQGTFKSVGPARPVVKGDLRL